VNNDNSIENEDDSLCVPLSTLKINADIGAVNGDVEDSYDDTVEDDFDSKSGESLESFEFEASDKSAAEGANIENDEDDIHSL